MRKNTILRPAGYVSVVDPDLPLVEEDTLQCVHCGFHWQVKPGSGNVRGFCGRCNGPICGAKCLKCVPIEQGLENMEAGRLEKEGDGRVSVPASSLSSEWRRRVLDSGGNVRGAISKIWTPGDT